MKNEKKTVTSNKERSNKEKSNAVKSGAQKLSATKSYKEKSSTKKETSQKPSAQYMDKSKSGTARMDYKKTDSVRDPRKRGNDREDNRLPKENILGDCIYARKCGGCQYQGMEYSKQLKAKQALVEELMGDMVKVEPILGMEQPFYYRNKVTATFDRLSNGTIISGVYKEGTHEVVDIKECQIEDKCADAIVQDIKGLLRSFKIKTYDEDSEYGLLRHIMVRTGHASGEVMVVLVLASPILPSKNNFVKAICKLHPEISTIVLNINERRTSMVLGRRNVNLYGKGFIEDTLCGLTFRVSPSSFYQINTVQTEVLYSKAMEYAKLTGKERVLDAYCGIGTIGMIAAKQAGEVLGVELNSSAVKDAITNAKRNEMKHITFYNRDASEFMGEMAEKEEKVDVVFMDPPRAGSTEAFMDAVTILAPKRVVYVSCNPETLARDLKYFAKKGYKAKKCQPVDMFPYTDHVETVVLLRKKDM